MENLANVYRFQKQKFIFPEEVQTKEEFFLILGGHVNLYAIELLSVKIYLCALRIITAQCCRRLSVILTVYHLRIIKELRREHLTKGDFIYERLRFLVYRFYSLLDRLRPWPSVGLFIHGVLMKVNIDWNKLSDDKKKLGI